MTDADERFANAMAVADAVLYEGYVLYPYYATSDKNRVRFQWGVVCPPGAEEDGAGEAPFIHTECLLEAGGDARLHILLRFLQLQGRTVEEKVDGSFRRIDELTVGDQSWVAWNEAVEREVEVPGLPVGELLEASRDRPVRLPGGRDVEELEDEDGRVAGRLVRERWSLSGSLTLDAERVDGSDGLVRLTLRLDNLAEWNGGDRTQALKRSFIAAHKLIGVDDGSFVSLMGPPEEAAEAAEACDNERTWPVLVGEPGDRDVVLSSPIILHDYPEIAPESPGPMFDATEIDELLTLRVQTLTDDEKRRAEATDERAAEIIEQADHLPDEALEKLHGAIRDFQPVNPVGDDADQQKSGGSRDEIGLLPGVPVFSTPADDEEEVVEAAHDDEDAPPWWDPGADASVDPETDTLNVGGVEVGRGSAVVLRPTRRADAHDMFLDGRRATVSAVFQDVDGDSHVAVTIDDDPGAGLRDDFGRYWYFRPDEVEPVGGGHGDE